MGTLPKHLRPRWRYLGLELETAAQDEIEKRAFQGALWKAARSLRGDVGSARLGLDVIRFELRDGYGTAIVRVHRGTETEARGIIATLETVDVTPIRATVRGVSGTIRACEENYLRIAREAPSHEVIALDDVEGPAIVRPPAVDIETDSTRIGATTLDIH